MPEDSRPEFRYRFGTFEFDTASGELRKNGRSFRSLQGQPAQMLAFLLESPGEIVSREQLRARLWPADTFVDYDHSLNSAINKLRDALGDAADSSRFIQTLPRRGYRFIAPVQVIGAPAATAESATSAPTSPPAPRATSHADSSSMPVSGTNAAQPKMMPLDVETEGPERPSVLSDAAELPVTPGRIVRTLFLLVQIMYLCFYVFFLANFEHAGTSLGSIISHPLWIILPLFFTALAGIPVRLYFVNAVLFGYAGVSRKFRKLFPALFVLDELWGLAPLLIMDRIGIGVALAFAAALLYLPFSQRSLLLMADAAPAPAKTL